MTNVNHSAKAMNKPLNLQQTWKLLAPVVWPLLKQEKRALLCAALLLPLVGGLQGAIPLVLKWAVDHVMQVEFPVQLLAFGLLGLVLLHGSSYYLQLVISQRAGLRFVQGFRERMIHHLLGLKLESFQKVNHGTWLTRLTADIENLVEMVSQTGISLFTDLAVFLACLASMLWLCWPLALQAYLLMALIMLIGSWLLRQSRQANENLRLYSAEVNDALEESLSGLDYVKTYGLEQKRLHLIKENNAQLEKAGLKVVAVDYGFSATIEFGGLLTLIVTLLSGSLLYGLQLQQGGEPGWLAFLPVLSLGTLVGLIQATQMAFAPLEEASQKLSTLQAALASLSQLAQLVKLEQKNLRHAPTKALPKPAGKLRIQNVSFTYPTQPDVQVLNSLSFTVHPGEKVALVGPSGSGKSTLMKLVLGFYQPQQGKLLLDGLPLEAYPPKEKHQLVGSILQDDSLFVRSLWENITLLPVSQRNKQEDEHVLNALEAAQLGQWLQSLPQGLSTLLDENAAGLSVGQRQLLLFARAFYLSPQLLVLDEATSAMDHETEKLVDTALSNLMRGRSVLLIAHRLSTIERADKVVFMKQGKLLAEGKHVELINTSAEYLAFMESQRAALASHSA